MDTCIRGFSYMPETPAVIDLQYIENGELERTWKVSRRQRLKDQEQKIWEEFVKEQDVVKTAYTEDPYQFLNELPEEYLKELMDAELKKMRKESEDELSANCTMAAEPPNQGEGDQPSDKQVVHTVTFAEDTDPPSDLDMFHIFDDDNDQNIDVSGPEDQSPPSSPGTVRERAESPLASSSPGRRDDSPGDKSSGKSAENVSSLIESSIYCARVKDLRLKLNEEMTAIMATLEGQAVLGMEPEEVSRRCRRAAEFSARFTRVHLYPLKRQVHDVERAAARALPAARHTQFQAQMLRVVSLHQNLLQATQVFHKSFPVARWLRSDKGPLRAVVGAARGVADACRALPAPGDLAAARDLYNDELAATCDRLDDAINEHNLRVAEMLSAADNAATTSVTTPSLKTVSGKPKKKARQFAPNSKSGPKSWTSKDTDTRLSMYSLDTQRTHTRPRDQHSPPPRAARRSPDGSPRAHKASKSRRPLMRAPCATRARLKVPGDADIATLVEGVGTCPSSHISREASPMSHERSPRRRCTTPRYSQKTTPRRVRVVSPKTKLLRHHSPKNIAKKLINTIKNDPQESTTSMRIASADKIQSARKDTGKDGNPDKNAEENIREGLGKGSRVKINNTPRSTESKVFTCTIKDNTEKDGQNERDGLEEVSSYRKEIVKQRDNFSNPAKEDSHSGKECASSYQVSESTECVADGAYSRCSLRNDVKDWDTSPRARNKALKQQQEAPGRCEVTRLLRQLCSREPSGSRNEKVSGAKNAQLLCISGGSPTRQPSTPQLLRILEETIQKKVPKPMYSKPVKNPERYRLNFNISENTAKQLFQYRTKFVQHMLTSPMYANSAVGKPWEIIGSVSEKIIDEVLASCASEMEINDVVQDLYKCETK